MILQIGKIQIGTSVIKTSSKKLSGVKIDQKLH